MVLVYVNRDYPEQVATKKGCILWVPYNTMGLWLRHTGGSSSQIIIKFPHISIYTPMEISDYLFRFIFRSDSVSDSDSYSDSKSDSPIIIGYSEY